MKTKTQKTIPEFKKKIIEELINLIHSYKTILLASIKNLPASQFQEISKKLRGKAVIKVPKKRLFIRAVENSQNKELKKIEEYFKNSTALLFSNLDTYELAYELIKNKSPAKAKAGQEAPIDIEIQAGPTDLPPGPAISELGSVGLQVQIEKGKIVIKEPRVIVKKGQKISHNVADVMNKLNIKPFSVGYIPTVGYNLEKNKLYLSIKINREEAQENLKEAFAKALSFAVNIGYYGKETIPLMIQKAAAYEKKLIKLISGETQEEDKKTASVTEATPVEENKTEEKKEEPKTDFAASFF